MAILLYGFPALLLNEYCNDSVEFKSVQESHKAGILFLSCFAFWGTIFGILSIHITVYNLFFIALSFFSYEIIISSKQYKNAQLSINFAILIRSLLIFPGFLFLVQTARNVLTLVIPFMGKIGTVYYIHCNFFYLIFI